MATILLVLFFTIFLPQGNSQWWLQSYWCYFSPFFFTTGKQPVMATILLVLFFTIFFYHRETASDGYNLTGTIFHHFYHRETASDGYNLTGTIFHHFFTTGKQPVMATILLVLFFTIFFLPQGNSQWWLQSYWCYFSPFFFTTGKQPVMATILLVLFFTIFFCHRETASDGYNTTASDGIAPDQLQWTAVTVSFWKNMGKLGWDGSNSLRLFFLVDPKERGSEMRWIYIHPLSKKKQGCEFFYNLDFFHGKKIQESNLNFLNFWTFWTFIILKGKCIVKLKSSKRSKVQKVQKKFLEYFFHGKNQTIPKNSRIFFMEKSSKSSWVIFVNDHWNILNHICCGFSMF